MKYGIIIMIASASLILFGCAEQADQPEVNEVTAEQIDYGVDRCEFTGELIETPRYGGKLELRGGDSFTFKSIECLAGFYLNMDDIEEVESLKVVDFVDGKRLRDVGEMKFLYSKLLPSPNGMYLSAVDASDEKMLTYVYDAYPGPYLEWDEVLELVADEWNLSLAAHH